LLVDKNFKSMESRLQNKNLFCAGLVFAFLGLAFFVSTQSVKAGAGNVTVGNPCTTSPIDNCGQGLNCVGSVCVLPSGTSPTLKFLGDTCVAGPECQSGNCVNSVCSAAAATTGATSGTCPTGLTMINGLCLPANPNTTGIASKTTLTSFLLELIKILLSFAGVIAVVMLVLGGYWYMAAGGNEEMSEKGRKTILNFVLGLVVIILAYTLVSIISSTLTGADKLLQ
jgi:NADH:ubiquinone oxidoreductase subunit 6 (subunit J)